MASVLKGKVVLITGASRGIGRACAVCFAKRGANIIITARSKEDLQVTASLVQKEGVRVLQEVADITERKNIKTLFQRAKEEFGRIDILINNAGCNLSGNVIDLDTDKLNYIFRLNFFAPLWCIQGVLPIMRSQGSGQIINISSIGGKRAIPFTGGYCASKFALNGLTEALRVELSGSNINVILVCPSGTDTDFYENTIKSTPGSAQPFKAKNPMEPEEVAEKILQTSLMQKREIIIGRRGKILIFLNRLNGAIVDCLLAKMFRSSK